MNTDKNLQGHWFLPGKDMEFNGGTFKYTRDEGCTLEIIGNFQKDSFFANEFHEIILGTTISGKKVTLVNCSRNSRQTNLNGVTVSKYHAELGLIGGHYLSTQELVFNKISFSVTDLESWVGIYGLKKLDFDYSNYGIELEYELPKMQNFELNDQLQVNVEFTFNSTPIKQTKNFKINQDTLLSLVSNISLPYKELLRHLFTLYKFLCFAYFDTPQILFIYVTNKNVLNVDDAKTVSNEILYSDSFFNSEYKTGKNPYEFLFSCEDIREKFPLIVTTWFSLYQKISPTINLFTELLFNRSYALEIQFLSAIQALETFHRNIIGGYSDSEEVHEKRIMEILEIAPEVYKKWLTDKLKYSNELTLKKRVAQIYDRIPTEITAKIISDKKVFLNDVVNSRNYFTHYSAELKERTMSSQNLHKSVEKIKILLISSILNELGFSETEIINIVQMHKVYPYIDI